MEKRTKVRRSIDKRLEAHLQEDLKSFKAINLKLKSQDLLLEEIKSQNTHQITQNDAILKITSQNAEMYTIFSDGKRLSSLAKWSFRVAVTFGGAYLMWKSIFK